MTTLTERVPLDEITAQARQVRPGVTAARLAGAVLFYTGWLAAKVLGVAWLAAAWMIVALREGWRASHGPSLKAQVATLEAEREELLTRLSRFSG